MTLLLSIALYLLTSVKSQCGYDEYHEEALEKGVLTQETWDEMEEHFEEEVEFWDNWDEDTDFFRRIRRLASDSDLTSRYFNGTLEIPVIVHVLYNPSHTVNLNDLIQLEQIQSQIIRLNMDFSSNNIENIPNSAFAALKANYMMSFKLHKVIRTQTSKTELTTHWEAADVKEAIDRNHYLNMYVSILGSNIGIGYAAGPGYAARSDYINIHYQFFGDPTFLWMNNDWKNTIGSKTSGRTATHEVGHWLHLEHPWGACNLGKPGDCTCSKDDHVKDTNEQIKPNFGCKHNAPPSQCGSLDMYQNFMDYSDDNCMALFTKGQLIRSLSILKHPYGQGRKELVDYQSVDEYKQGPFVNDIYFRESLKASDPSACGPGDVPGGLAQISISPPNYMHICYSTTNNKYVHIITKVWHSKTMDNDHYCVKGPRDHGYLCYQKGEYSDNGRMTPAQVTAKIGNVAFWSN